MNATLKRKIRIKFLVLLCMAYISAHAQMPEIDVKMLENNLIKIGSKIFPFYYSNQDSLAYYSDLFSKNMVSYVKNNPATISDPFQSFIDNKICDVITSDDNLFRIYSWNTWMGGTMRFFENIYQYKSQDKIFSVTDSLQEGDPSGFYSEIFTLNAKNKKYYLAIMNGIYSTKDASQSIKIFTIENGKLNDTLKLIKNKTEFLNSINVEFDFFSVVDRPERPLKLIKYDAKKQMIYIPVVLEEGKVTNRFIQYKFTGQYFEKFDSHIQDKNKTR